MKPIAFSVLLLAMSFGMGSRLYGQDVFASTDTLKKITPAAKVKEVPKGPKAIKHEVSVGYRLHTSGWSAYADIGKVKARNVRQSDMFYNINYWQIEFSEKKSPKQEKLTVDDNSTGRSTTYIYGKINNFYGLKLGYGFRKMIAGKPDPGSVSIHWSNVIGASLGMVKPYYLNVLSTPSPIKYSEATKDNFLSQTNNIVGAAGFGMGLSEMKFVPGGHFKSMLHFDFSANRKTVAAIEAGIDVEYYAEPIPIMANQKDAPLFFDLFVSFQFGKRW